MSTYPQPVVPFSDAKPPRPGSLTTIAIIGIVLGGLGILCNVPNLIVNATGASMQIGPNPSPKPTPEMRFTGTIVGFVSIVMWVWLLIGSVGTLGLRPWARRTMLLYAAVHLVVLVALLIVTIKILNPEAQKMMEVQIANVPRPPNAPPPPDMKPFFGVIMMLSAFFFWILFSVLPLFILILFRRRHIVDAFAGVGLSPYPPAQTVPQAH